jgi:hypothetical protein
MADADLKVTFSADVSGLRSGMDEALSSIKSLRPPIEDAGRAVAAFGAALAASFKPPGAAGLQAAAAQGTTALADALTAASAAKAAAQARAVNEDERLDAIRLRADAQVNQIELQDEQRTLDAEARLHEVSGAALLAQRQVLETQRLQIQEDAAKKQLDNTISHQDQIKAIWGQGTAQYEAAVAAQARAQAQYDAQMEVDQAQSRARMLQENLQYLEQLAQQWHGYINPVVSAFGSGMTQMIQGTKTFGQAMAQVGQSILQVFVGIGERMVENWLVSLITNQAASKLSSHTQVAANAAVAGSAAVASTAAIPIIGPELAPAAGFAAYSEALAFEALAEGGFDVPAGLAPVTKLHPQEMVLPARLANPLRDMIAANGASGSGDGLGSTGDTHNHLHLNVSAIDGPSVLNHIRGNRDAYQTAFAEMVRGGMARKMGLATV